jgi:hypothetical protein
MTTPRPDQFHRPHTGGPGGSRSGAGDLAASLGYPGVPPATPNCNAAVALRRAIGGSGTFFTFPEAGRIWVVTLSYTVVTAAGFSTAPQRFAAYIQTGLASVPLAVVELSLATTPDHDSDTSSPPYSGLPLVQGDSLELIINGGVAVGGVNQEASAIVLYSIP